MQKDDIRPKYWLQTSACYTVAKCGCFQKDVYLENIGHTHGIMARTAPIKTTTRKKGLLRGYWPPLSTNKALIDLISGGRSLNGGAPLQGPWSHIPFQRSSLRIQRPPGLFCASNGSHQELYFFHFFVKPMGFSRQKLPLMGFSWPRSHPVFLRQHHLVSRPSSASIFALAASELASATEEEADSKMSCATSWPARRKHVDPPAQQPDSRIPT